MWVPSGRVVPGEERAGHVSRPPAGPLGPTPDLDTPPRSSAATRSADAGFPLVELRPVVPVVGWCPARDESGTCRDLGQVCVDCHWISARPLVPRGLLDHRVGSFGCVGSRWSSGAGRGTSRARVETSGRFLWSVIGSRHGRSFLAAYSISGLGVPPFGPYFRWSSSVRRGTSWTRVETSGTCPWTFTRSSARGVSRETSTPSGRQLGPVLG